MDITHKRLNRVDLLSVSGRLDAMSAPQFKQRIDELFDQGRYRIVLDLSGLEYVASPGLRVLIEARKRARDWKLTDLEGGDVRIANLPPRIKEVFDLTEPEILATFQLLTRVKAWLDAEHAPAGYNIGWNCGRAGGQEVFHAHMHVMPRFRKEPLAGKGIRSLLKSDANRW